MVTLNIENLTGENNHFYKFRTEIILSEHEVLNFVKGETNVNRMISNI